MVFKATDKLKIGTKDPYAAIKVLSKEFKTHPNAVAVLINEVIKSQKMHIPILSSSAMFMKAVILSLW